MSNLERGEGMGAPTMIFGCVCPLLLGGEKREGDSGVTQGDWGVVWAQGIWSPGVPGCSIDGVCRGVTPMGQVGQSPPPPQEIGSARKENVVIVNKSGKAATI